ncbi:MAG: response regulator transcription factor [Alphaproteobacteria bacterium]|nr:response regulator transcription factor [Alphaproteobacteria bacterium]
MRVLIIEDDEDVSAFIAKGIKEAGHTADIADDGREGLFRATTENYDVLIVDRMLPALDGLTIIRTLRGAGADTPALILSALGDIDDRVTGLRSGGDDYLVKPFAFSELLARVEVLGRRTSGTGKPGVEQFLEAADLKLDLLARTASRGGKTIDLQATEFRLLRYLLENKGKVVTRTMLLEHVWDYHFDPQTNVIDVHISRLRSKIDKDRDRPLIRTVRGSGYIVDG